MPQSTRASISPCPARSGGTLAPTLFAAMELLRHGLDSFDSICWGPMRAFLFVSEMEFSEEDGPHWTFGRVDACPSVIEYPLASDGGGTLGL